MCIGVRAPEVPSEGKPPQRRQAQAEQVQRIRDRRSSPGTRGLTAVLRYLCLLPLSSNSLVRCLQESQDFSFLDLVMGAP